MEIYKRRFKEEDRKPRTKRIEESSKLVYSFDGYDSVQKFNIRNKSGDLIYCLNLNKKIKLSKYTTYMVEDDIFGSLGNSGVGFWFDSLLDETYDCDWKYDGMGTLKVSFNINSEKIVRIIDFKSSLDYDGNVVVG